MDPMGLSSCISPNSQHKIELVIVRNQSDRFTRWSVRKFHCFFVDNCGSFKPKLGNSDQNRVFQGDVMGFCDGMAPFFHACWYRE